MITVNESVIEKTSFEKVAEYELPKNVSEWSEEILDQFYDQINYLPKEFNTEVIIKSVDENEGYAKGSVVVWYNSKQINFPVIVKDFKLSPFDVFVNNNNDTPKYLSANLRNIKKILTSEEVGIPKRNYPKGSFDAIKSVGGVYPKTAVNTNDTPGMGNDSNFSKISSWPITAHNDDMEKFAVQMKVDKNISQNFIDNTGDLVNNIIELNRDNRTVVDDHKSGILDTYKIIKAKQVVTVLDSQFVDVNKLKPMIAPVVCELRVFEYPSLEDFIESGKSVAGRFLATTNGKPVPGIVIDNVESRDLNRKPNKTVCSDDTKKMENREHREQIFFSLDGKFYCKYRDYSRIGIGFYGSNVLTQDGAMQKAIQHLAKNASDEFANIDSENKNDGADKSFLATHKHMQYQMDQGKKGTDEACPCDCNYGNIFVIYGANNSFECVSFMYRFKKYKVNNSHIYVSREEAIVPANVASVQLVGSVKDPFYKMILGKVKRIFLVPESSLIINSVMMRRLSDDDFLKPGKTIQKTFEDANINKVALYVKDGGYHLDGKSFEPLKKVAHLGNNPMSTDQTFKALGIMGVNKNESGRAMKVALSKYANDNTPNKVVTIYGVNDDYIDTNVINHIEKAAKLKNIIKEECVKMRIDLIKEASVLDDPEAVDVVLSLNFINEDNLNGYIENIREMKKVAGDLAELLIASRMGLKTIEEGAVKKAMDGINTVVENLEKVKMAIED